MFVFYYVVILSFTYLLTHGEGESPCDCSGLKEMVQQLLSEKEMVSTRLRRLEAKQKAPTHSTPSISNDRLEKLEKNVEDLKMKFNDLVTTAKNKQDEFVRNIDAVMTKALKSEKKEKRQLVLKINKTILDHKEKDERFMVTMNNTIYGHMEYVTAIQNKQSQKINEIVDALENITANSIKNMSAFQNEQSQKINETMVALENMTANSLRNMSKFLNGRSQKINETVVALENMTASSIGFALSNISAFQNEQSQKINETMIAMETMTTSSVSFALSNISAFQNEQSQRINETMEALETMTANSVKNMSSFLNEQSQKINETMVALENMTASSVRFALSNISAFQNEQSQKINEAMTALENMTANSIKNVSAFQNEQSQKINETMVVLENMTASSIKNMSTFQKDTAENVNMTLDAIVSEIRDKINELHSLVEEEKDWLPWSNWGECSASCNGGLRERNRTCASSLFGCNGNSKDFSLCNIQSCGDWLPWSEWGLCSAQCDAGLRERTRTCSSSLSGCNGNSKDFSICNTRSCVVRLVNGSSPYEGRLEVFHNGDWGTVCDDSFTKTSAEVACKMLNVQSVAKTMFSSAHFGQGSVPILLDDVECDGSESSIFSCPHRPVGNHNCGHGEDVGISCQPPVRLVNGRNNKEGRLEVYIISKGWGTVCDDSFSILSAHVVCKMLGFPSVAPKAFSSAHFGQGSLPILLDNVVCDGSESSIFSCKHSQVGEHNCGHHEDVGILCS